MNRIIARAGLLGEPDYQVNQGIFSREGVYIYMNQSCTARVTAFAMAVTLMMTVMALTALVASGCGGNTPGSASNEMVQRLSDRKFDEAYDSLSASSPIRQVKREDFIAQMSASLPEGTTITEFSITEEKTEGDKSTVSWKAKVNIPGHNDQTLDDKFDLVNEDGTWKVEQ